ncbi:hypothetical protein QK292_17515 [Arthrobacter sp. AL08]|uniref:hypothetical protein n=1 Tax=unclassified Arthrobacter TaxID=235627 RepID=UPI00249B3AE5|nr:MULTISPECIES: hypothetical protein [unclassified Arthrobacter]MDI3243341.1 hypothetical protein [Arthrobacter sp. AL05]MDI3279353.1 hypothetical protein [Arthrobacter sp. AL08]
MSAGTIARPDTAPAPPPGARRAGHTRITSAALHHTVEAITAAAFGIPAREVKARIHDDHGHMAVTVAVALAVPSLNEAARNTGIVTATGGTLYERAGRARAEIIDDAMDIAGATVAQVDIRLTGLHHGKKEGALR